MKTKQHSSDIFVILVFPQRSAAAAAYSVLVAKQHFFTLASSVSVDRVAPIRGSTTQVGARWSSRYGRWGRGGTYLKRGGKLTSCHGLLYDSSSGSWFWSSGRSKSLDAFPVAALVTCLTYTQATARRSHRAPHTVWDKCLMTSIRRPRPLAHK